MEIFFYVVWLIMNSMLFFTDIKNFTFQIEKEVFLFYWCYNISIIINNIATSLTFPIYVRFFLFSIWNLWRIANFTTNWHYFTCFKYDLLVFSKWVFSWLRTSSKLYEVPTQWKLQCLHWYFILFHFLLWFLFLRCFIFAYILSNFGITGAKSNFCSYLFKHVFDMRIFDIYRRNFLILRINFYIIFNISISYECAGIYSKSNLYRYGK